MKSRPRFHVGVIVATTRRIRGYDVPHLGKAPDLPTGTALIILEAKGVPTSLPNRLWRYRTRPAAGVADAEYWVDEDALDKPLLVQA